MEHDFQVNLDTMKKKKEILPELYKKIMIAYSHYVFNDDKAQNNKREFTKNGIKYLGELRNYLTFNKFFLDKPIYNQAREFDEIFRELIAVEHSEHLSVRNDIIQMTTEELEIKRTEIHNQLKEKVEKLDKLIYDDLNN